MQSHVSRLIAGVFCLLMAGAIARADDGPPARGGVALPYSVSDGENQWIVQRGGWLQQQGNMPVFGQAANLTVNGQGPQGNLNRASLDKQTGELLVEGLQIAGVGLTRRIQFRKDDGNVRYLDLFSNRTGQEMQLAVMMQTSLNFGVNGGQVINDPKREDVALAWVAATAGGPTALGLYAGRGARVSPQVTWQPGNSFVQVTYNLKIPANGQIALLHVHGTTGSPEQGEQFVRTARETQLLAGLPVELRRSVVNFRPGGTVLGERELLRGETLDVIELRSGDQLRGTLVPAGYAVQTGFGEIELPADRVVGILAMGAFRPRQLVVTADGEIVGGTLKGDSIAIQLSGGQTTAVPLSQISRVGYRMRPGEADEIPFTRPLIVLRSGDRLAFEPPAEPVEMLTRFGVVKLPWQKFATLDLSGLESAAHVATLADGSRFSGLVQSAQWSMKLPSAGGRVVTLPVGSVAAVQLAAEAPEPSSEAATLELVGGDVLVAPLTGTLQLDTAFDTLTIRTDEVVAVTPAPGTDTPDADGSGSSGGFDVKITLWDQTVISGQLREPVLACALAGEEVRVAVPVPLLRAYAQPSPRPGEAVVKHIRSIVDQLSADDFLQREAAEAQLVNMGKIVVPLLRDWRATLPLEGQQRTDSILKKLDAAGQAAGPR